MDNLLARKLELFGPLSSDDRQFLDEVIAKPRSVATHQDIIREGDAPDDVHLILSGMACRYKLLPEGKRSILAYLIPGDFCDLHIFILKAMDHGISTLADSEVVEIPRPRILELTHRPAIARALWWITLVDEAILREALVNVGRRDAESSIAHLICEIHLRLKSVGKAEQDVFALPITQEELADTVGLSTVHVNRSLMSLRHRDLIEFRRGRVHILNVHRLRDFCDFNPNYLHLDAGESQKM